MANYNIFTNQIKNICQNLKAGDLVSLSGIIYTARDAAHKRIINEIENGKNPPFEIDGATIYYAGPTPERNGKVIGSIGPTTSGRMDIYTPKLLDCGLCCMIGKGIRNEQVIKSIIQNKAVYMVAIGGAGALKANCVKKAEVIAYDDLGCESVKRLTVENFTAIVSIDCSGGNLYKQGIEMYKNKA